MTILKEAQKIAYFATITKNAKFATLKTTKIAALTSLAQAWGLWYKY